LTNFEKNELQSMFVVLVTEQVEVVTMIQVPLVICYAGCHVKFIAVDLSTLWSGPAVSIFN